ncbi:Wzz/FepE/Etk N-terminal domain-containing protein [Thiomicrorhabdus sp. zzn3]|uniref:LPS O-antigen chain length determinant protein WzzB n=1 Tax=Thiomicrorhabdus sp. zzn3 TaxID=3039775 RepID=UPI002436A19B|nr:Wzz/FepE/Etk N-terminal domain-containing protein [Thiomicrorhabdus sp. zzn3]MDG6777390.1 Wzz/FepE/Etk N-terminal domain-containing protein [Thiomicrorhabdus sp. zzn3]
MSQENQAPSLPASNNTYNDEIDLFELWNGILQEKWTVIISFLAATLLALLYAFTATPVYKATAYFLPPSVEDVQEMNALNLVTGSDFYQPEEVYKNFIEHLRSRDVSQAIFNQFNLISLYQPDFEKKAKNEQDAIRNIAFETFSSDISVHTPKKNSTSNEVSIDLALKRSPQETADILNELVRLAQIKTAQQYLKDIQSELNIRKQRLHDRIASLRKIEKERRLDRIARLEEAANIARSLNLADPLSAGPQINVQGVANQGLPTYYLGYKLLEAELNALRKRENDDPFISQLRGLQQNLTELQELKLDVNKFAVVTVDQYAIPPASPAKPKKALIVAVGGVLGLMLGVFIALIRRAIKNHQNPVSISQVQLIT